MRVFFTVVAKPLTAERTLATRVPLVIDGSLGEPSSVCDRRGGIYLHWVVRLTVARWLVLAPAVF